MLKLQFCKAASRCVSMYGVWPVGTLVLKVDWSQNVKAAIMFISTTNSSIGFVELLSSILSVFCYGDYEALALSR